MLEILEKVISIFLIIGVGFFAGRKKMLPDGTRASLSALTLKITCPSMILAATLSHEVSDSTLSVTVWSIVLSLMFFVLFIIVGYIVSKYVLREKDNETVGMYTYGFHTTNTGFFAFPVTLALFGNSIFYVVVMQNTIMSFFLFGLGLIAIDMITGKGSFNFKSLYGILRSPPIVASFLGIALMFSGIALPAPLLESISIIGSSTTPLSMILVGLMLADCDIRALLTDKGLIAFSAIKNVLMPILCWLILAPLPVHNDVKVGLIFAFAFPTAVMVAPMVESYGYKPDKAAEMIAMTTIISIVTIPVCAALLTAYYGL